MPESGLTVASIEFIDEEVDVFDIEVETDHSFLVHGAVLHNCPSCGALDSKVWKVGETHPMPSLHWSCRCMILPKTKSWEELAREAGGNTDLAKKLDQMDPGTRASMDGQVAAGTTYEDWLKGKSEPEQRAILGDKRFDIMQKGKLSLSDLTNQGGRALTLKELAAL
jgi:hypothetical protein